MNNEKMPDLVAAMQERVLGRTQLKVKILGVGGISPQEVVEKALAYGLNFFDVHCYVDSQGKDNRTRFRKALAKCPRNRSDLVLTDRSYALSKEELLADLDKTLDMLGVEYLDIYGLYNITQSADRVEKASASGGAIEGLREAKAEGKIKFIGGVSGHHHRELVRLIQKDEFDAVMVAINLFDQDVINSVLPVTQELNMGTIAMKPFAKGLFTCNPEAALNYVFSQNISVAIPGMMTLGELEKNIRIAARFSGISESDLSALKREADEISKREGRHICRQCGYCVPVCPQEIDIKDLFYQERQANRYYSKDWAQAAYAKVTHKADECIECGACEGECPYDLPIREMLKQVHVDLST
ncbi:MAG: aldo/keto reductase [Planctomycetes bacterium]|nr:aldo/keto reductase [Planctomycetota bacterium]